MKTFVDKFRYFLKEKNRNYYDDLILCEFLHLF